MPSDPKKESSSSRQPAGSSSKQKSTSRPSSSRKPLTSAEVRAKEHDALILQLLESHSSPYYSPLLRLSTTFQLPADILAYTILSLFLVVHLFLPVFLLPHWSALVTLVIPVRCTLGTLALELNRIEKSKKEPTRYAGDAGQWLVYWVVYALMGFAGGWVRLWRPGWCGVYEVVRSMWLVVVGGGWFARKVLHSSGPSSELTKAVTREKEEQAAQQRTSEEKKRAKKEEEKAKDKENKEKRQRARREEGREKARKERGK